jgi:hypothetical protein
MLAARSIREGAMNLLPLLSGLAIAVVLPSAAHAQVNKCVDPATGKTTYLQTPCPSNARSQTVKKAAPASAPAPAATSAGAGSDSAKAAGKTTGPKTAAELEQDFRKRRQEQDDARKKDAEKLAQAKAKEDNCRNARAQLVTIESGVRQARVNEKGERIFLEDAQIEQEKARARSAVDQWCK